MNFKKIFIDINHQIHIDDEAEDKLKTNSDSKYFTSNGSIKVDKERWEKAQYFEESYWMSKALNESDDRNFEHEERFNFYDKIAKLNIQSAIELGCGPFTNMRIIKSYCRNLKDISLLDPLLRKYLMHPNCTYKGSNYTLIPSSIEDFEPQRKYDMVVIINVLEHCYDVDRIFNVIDNCLDKDGILVISEPVIMEKDLEFIKNNWTDSGHPIRITENYLRNYLNKYESLVDKEYNGLYGNQYRKDIYYIGKIK